MASTKYYIVDVFAEEKYAGNQLAVFLNAGSLSPEVMQRLANEMHFSETTFIASDEEHNGGYDVRIFTPDEELPFAGHPTLGTAYIIKHEIMKNPGPEIRLNLGVGQITVTIDDPSGVLWMKQKEPVFLRRFDPSAIANMLGIDESDIDDRFPTEEVSTGISFVVVPLKDLRSIKDAYLDLRKYNAFFGDKKPEGLLVFCPETLKRENNLHVRVFTKFPNVLEDPATGSGNGCLAAYLVRHQYFSSSKVDIRVEQGCEMGRPSLLFLRSEDTGGHIDVNVGGKVIPIAKGELE
jgi:trans-2,3-dihydro-3-hydroxyanthranilate isomerase